MKPAPIVCDTGPLLHLHEAGALELLPLAGSVHIPPGVGLELAGLISNWPAQAPSWLRATELAPPFSGQAGQWKHAGLLHRGESEALALALQLSARWFLTDDTSARVMAQSLRVETHGSLGIVLWAAAHHHLSPADSRSKLEGLFASSLWVSPVVQGEARQALDRILSSL